MTPEQFAYWMQGFVELTKGAQPSAEQWRSIREHLDTVFKKVTPSVEPTHEKASGDLDKYMKQIAERDAQRQQYFQQMPPGYPWPTLPLPHWIQPETSVPSPVNPMTVTC